MERSLAEIDIPLYKPEAINISPDISDCGDLVLNKEDMLPVMTRVDLDIAAKAGALWAFYKWRHLGNQLGAMYCAGASVVIKSGLCKVVRSDEKSPIDGAWIYAVNSIPNLNPIGRNLKSWLQEWLSTENLDLALKIIIATKLNWWLTGKHTGEPNVQGDLQEVLSVKFGNNIDERHLTMASTIGRWASTINILNKAGIPGLPVSQSYTVHVDAEVVIGQEMFSPELKRSFALEPAGTERLAISYRAAKRLVASPLAKYCPRFEEFGKIAITIARKLSIKPGDFHMYTRFLTGLDHGYDDTEFENMLGRLGTYVRVILPESTLASSPLLTESKVQSYEDFCPEWYNLLKRYKEAGPTVLEGIELQQNANAILLQLKSKFNPVLPKMKGIGKHSSDS